MSYATRCPLAALVLVLILGALPASSTAAPVPLPNVPGPNDVSAGAGRCLGLMLMSDKSASQARTDPGNLRIRAARFAIDMLSELSNTTVRHSAGVVSFGSSAPASAAVGFRPLPDLTKELATSLTEAPTLGGTNFPAAFARVERLIRASVVSPASGDCERRRFVVFVYSDLMPNSGSGRLDRQFRKIRLAVQRLRALGARTHVFAFSHRARVTDLVRRWRATGVSSAVPVRTLSDGELEHSYAKVLAGELGLGDGATARLSAGARSSSFVVPELSDRLIVVPFALTRTHLRLTSPSGAKRDIHGLEVVDRPAAGRWSVTLVRGPSTAVGSYAAPATVRITSPGPVVPLGSEMRPEVTVTTSTGAPIRATGPSVTVEATISVAGRRPRPVELQVIGVGRFRAKRPLEATDVGPARVAVSIAVGSREVRRAARAVDVRRIAYLAFTSAFPRAGRALTVPLQLRLGGHAVDAQQVLEGSPHAIAVATLHSPGGRVEHTAVRWTGDSRFEARFSQRVEADRPYAVNVQMVDRTAQSDGPKAAAVSTILVPRSTFADRVWRLLRIVLLAMISALVAVVVGGLARMFLGGRIGHDVEVPVYGGDTVSVYGGRRLAFCGGPWPVRPLTFVFAARGGTVLALQSRIPRPWGAHPVQRPPGPRRLRRTPTPIRGGSR